MRSFLVKTLVFSIIFKLSQSSFQDEHDSANLFHRDTLEERDGADFDPKYIYPAPGTNGRPMIAQYAALGDSFTAGPSAGDEWDGNKDRCRSYSKALGPQVNEDTRLPLPENGSRDFFFPACTGAVFADMKSQIKDFKATTDMATLTIGGNDVFFSDIVNACVYRVLPGDCDDLINRAHTIIDSKELFDDYGGVISDIFKKAPSVRLYVSGYPTFFNELSDQCDKISFNPWSSFAGAVYVTKALRHRLNTLVVDLNNRILDVVDQSKPGDGGFIAYVDPNDVELPRTRFDSHRFCEPENIEPDYNNPNIYFYHYTWQKKPWLANQPGCNESSTLSQYVCGMKVLYGENSTSDDPTPPVHDQDGNWASDWLALKRIFHPTIGGFTAMKDSIVARFLQDFDYPGKDAYDEIVQAIDAPANKIFDAVLNAASINPATVTGAPSSATSATPAEASEIIEAAEAMQSAALKAAALTHPLERRESRPIAFRKSRLSTAPTSILTDGVGVYAASTTPYPSRSTDGPVAALASAVDDAFSVAKANAQKSITSASATSTPGAVVSPLPASPDRLASQIAEAFYEAANRTAVQTSIAADSRHSAPSTLYLATCVMFFIVSICL